MSSANQSEPTGQSISNSIWQNERVRRLLLYAAVLVVIFLGTGGVEPSPGGSPGCESKRD